MIQVAQISCNILNTKCIKDSYIIISGINLTEFPLFSQFLCPLFSSISQPFIGNHPMFSEYFSCLSYSDDYGFSTTECG